MITEALALNTPVVVNERIVGGWKYVNERAGALFTSADDVGAPPTSLAVWRPRRVPRRMRPAGELREVRRFLRQMGIPADETAMLGT